MLLLFIGTTFCARPQGLYCQPQTSVSGHVIDIIAIFAETGDLAVSLLINIPSLTEIPLKSVIFTYDPFTHIIKPVDSDVNKDLADIMLIVGKRPSDVEFQYMPNENPRQITGTLSIFVDINLAAEEIPLSQELCGLTNVKDALNTLGVVNPLGITGTVSSDIFTNSQITQPDQSSLSFWTSTGPHSKSQTFSNSFVTTSARTTINPNGTVLANFAGIWVVAVMLILYHQ